MHNDTLSADVLKQEYGDFFAESPLADFNPCEVPENLRCLIPHARFWGISDDWQREQLASKAPKPIQASLKEVVAEKEDALDKWLAGAEASSAIPSEAYVAFSAMRMCVDIM